MTVLCHLHTKEVLPFVETELLFQFVLALGTTEESLAASSLCPPFMYLYTLMRSFLNLLFSKLISPSSQSLLILEMFQSFHHPLGPLQNSLQYVYVSLVQRNIEPHRALQL